MGGAHNIKLTFRTVEHLSKVLPENNVFDTEIAGFHVRPDKRGLTFRLFYRTKAGKQRILTLGRYGVITVKEARLKAVEALSIVAKGDDPRAVLEEAKIKEQQLQHQTIGAYLSGPYATYQSRRKDGEATLKRIKRDFADWLNKPMSSLTRADLERWQAVKEGRKEAKGKKEAQSKPQAFGTMNRSYGALSSMLSHAAERNVIPANPLKGVKLQRPVTLQQDQIEQALRRRYLEPEEVEALFQGLDGYQEEKRKQRRNSRSHGKAFLPDLDQVTYVDHVKPWVLLMFYTGFRPGDVAGLSWDHVNLAFKTIRKTIEKTAHHRPEPQTFPLSNAVVDVLGVWHGQKGKPKAGLVFPNPATGKRFDRTAMQKPWAKVRKLGGLPDDLQLYSLRHNFASQLVMSGADLLAVSRLMAHSDIQTTIQHYAHLRPDHTRDIVETFAQRQVVSTHQSQEYVLPKP